MAKIKLFPAKSWLHRFNFEAPENIDSATLYRKYKCEGGIRNFVRFVLAFIREQDDQYDVTEDEEFFDNEQ